MYQEDIIYSQPKSLPDASAIIDVRSVSNEENKPGNEMSPENDNLVIDKKIMIENDDIAKTRNDSKGDDRRGSSCGYDVPPIQTFYPTWEQFQNFKGFIDYVESTDAHKAGICRIIPPSNWFPRKNGYDIDDLNISIATPICQVVTGRSGVYEQVSISKEKLTVKEFQEIASSSTYTTPPHQDFLELERKYWENVTYISPIYGADVNATLTDSDCPIWNVNNLDTILDYVHKDYGLTIDGINTTYLYFGMWKTTFPWHTEDMDLYSINYLHFGAPKTWYAIPQKHARRFETLVAKYFPESRKHCSAYLRHKMTLVSPTVLKENSIPFDVITQEQGQIIVTFPYGYHSGFNHGFNCAEATNFATMRWIEYGKRVTQCKCNMDMVHFSMDTFVKRFQPERYESWILGEDYGPHPEEPFAESDSESVDRNVIEYHTTSQEDQQKILEMINGEAEGNDGNNGFNKHAASLKRRSTRTRKRKGSDDEEWKPNSRTRRTRPRSRRQKPANSVNDAEKSE